MNIELSISKTLYALNLACRKGKICKVQPLFFFIICALSESLVNMAIYYRSITLYIFSTGDMGGYMGLLLGASVMTVIEVIDLLFYQTILKFIYHSGKNKRISSADSTRAAATPIAWGETKDTKEVWCAAVGCSWTGDKFKTAPLNYLSVINLLQEYNQYCVNKF